MVVFGGRNRGDGGCNVRIQDPIPILTAPPDIIANLDSAIVVLPTHPK